MQQNRFVRSNLIWNSTIQVRLGKYTEAIQPFVQRLLISIHSRQVAAQMYSMILDVERIKRIDLN